MEVKRTERGWAGHFICSHSCLFRRNTLLEYEKIKIVVSTVGLLPLFLYKENSKISYQQDKFMEIEYQRHYETMAFHSDPNDTRYYDIDVSKQVSFNSPWFILELDADDRANDMHEEVVREITEGLLQGKTYEPEY